MDPRDCPSPEAGSVFADQGDQPWLGLAAYSEEDQSSFYGREEEAAALLRLIERDRLVVIFGRSGLGKTSLLRAGVFPRLRERDYFPVYIRLSFDAGSPSLAAQVKATITSEACRLGIEAPGPFEGQTLWEFFNSRDSDFWDAKNRLLTPVLIFDQFEELFTLGAGDAENRSRVADLTSELADLVENQIPDSLQDKFEQTPDLADQYISDVTRHKVVFSLREDYLPHLETWRTRIPSVGRTRFRLTHMTGSQALEAVLKPGKDLIDKDTAEKLVTFVASREAEDLSTLEIEPALLSVVCNELNLKRLAGGQARITIDLLAGAQEEIITGFYQRTVAGLSPAARIFIEERLLTGSGYRDSAPLEDFTALEGVNEETVGNLVDRRLVRVEERFGAARLELTHDLLTGVIQTARDQRRELELLEEEQSRAAELRRKLNRSRLYITVFAGLALVMAVAVILAGVSLRQASVAREQAAQALVQAEQARDSAEQARDVAEQAHQEAEEERSRAIGVLRSIEQVEETFQTITPALAEIYGRRAERALDRHDWAGAVIQSIESLSRKDHNMVRWIAGIGAKNLVQEGDPSLPAALTFQPVEPLADNIDHAENLARINDQQEVTSMSFIPDSDRLAVGLRDGSIRIVDTGLEKEVGILLGHLDEVRAVSSSADGRLLASGSRDNTIRIWDVAGQKEIGVLNGHERSVSSVAFSPDGRLLASGSRDNTIRLWDVAGQKEICVLEGPDRGVSSVVFSPDGRLLASGSWEKTIRLWDVAEQKQVGALEGHDRGITALSFSPDGRLLASGSWDYTIRLWDVAGQKEIGVLKGDDEAIKALKGLKDGFFYIFTPRILSLAFSPDNRLLASGLGDKTIRLWDVAARKEIGALKGHEHNVSSVVFSPDGRFLVSGSRDETVRRWPVPDSEFILEDHDRLLADLAVMAEYTIPYHLDGDGEPVFKGPVEMTLLKLAGAEQGRMFWMPNHGREMIEEYRRAADSPAAMWLAVTEGDLPGLKGLLARGQDTGGRDDSGRTLLMAAAGAGQLEMSKFLIAAGADVNAVDQEGRTPLLFAAKMQSEFENVGLTKLLLKKGASVKAVDKDGRTALMLAVREGNMHSAEQLMNAGADIDAVDKDGWTPLMFAAANGKRRLFTMLVEAGADTTIKAKDGQTAADKKQRSRKIVRTLK